MYKSLVRRVRRGAKTTIFWVQAAVLASASMAPFLMQGSVAAAQLTSRNVNISSSVSGKTGVSYTFNFTFASTSQAQGIIIEFCTTPLGSCTQPTGMNVSTATASVNTSTNATITPPAQTFTGTTAFTEVATTTGDCVLAGTSADTKYCVSRTDTTTEAATAKSITIENITNPTLGGSATLSVYPRISIYSNNTFTPGAGGVNVVQYGVVATAITQQLTVQGRVQERLEFCVAAVGDTLTDNTVDDTLPANCAAAPTTTTVDLGIIDSSSIVRSPADATPTNGANDYFGIAMINTNAAGGASIVYYPNQDTNVANSDTDQLRSFRVANADCSATSTATTDQCFVMASNTGDVFSPGTEHFGMYIPCITANDGTISTTANLSADSAYSGTDGDTTTAIDCENEGRTPETQFKYAWNDSGTAQQIASASTVIDDEIVKLSFAATASPTTPTGLYRVTTTYIATPTF